MTVPIWFLDIDGVINSMGLPLPDTGVDSSTYRKIGVSDPALRASRRIHVAH